MTLTLTTGFPCQFSVMATPDTNQTNDNAPNYAQPSANVAAIQFKLPPFWLKDQAMWFIQRSAQFTTCSITVSRTKFDYMVSSLSPKYAAEVWDLLLNSPAEQPYETLKRVLMNHTSVSEQHYLQQLQTIKEELGDHKPSQVLWRM